MMTFLALAHMVDASQVMIDVLCTCTHGRCYANHGVVGLMTFHVLPTLTCPHVRYYATDGWLIHVDRVLNVIC